MELELVQFIRQHDDWENLLQEKPYCLTISRDNLFGKNLVMFKYSQIDSDFSQEIVKESRGLILEEGSWEVVSYPFRKFMNYGEPAADQIDWSTARVTQKIDGSLIKVVHLGNDLLISTNGTIDAFKAPIPEQIGCKYQSFGELAQALLENHLGKLYLADCFTEGFTYMFELVSPWTRVVIPYDHPELYFLGNRNNYTFQEISFDDSLLSKWFPVPKVYSFGSFEDCVQNAAQLPWDQEGYVVNDAHFNRVKVKSVAWIQVHHLKDNGVLSYARCLELVRLNEVGEVLNYFPEFKDEFAKIEDVYDKFVSQDEAAWEYLCQEFDLETASRKDLALFIQRNFNLPGVGFAMLDKKVSSVKEWYQNCNIDKLVNWLGLK